MILIDLTLRKLLITCLQRFLEVFISCLSLMTIGKLQLAIVRKIGFENRVVGVAGRAFNAFTEKRIRIAMYEIRIAFVKFEFCDNEGFESITRRFKSFSLTFSFILDKRFESITQRFESLWLVLHNSKSKDSNRCKGDSNPASISSLVLHERFESFI